MTNKFTIAALLLSDDVLSDLRREIRRFGSGVKVEVDYLRSVLASDIIKRELIDSDEAKTAGQNVKRLQRAVTRKRSSEKQSDEQPEEPPVVAPVEDAAGTLPRAAVTP